MCFLSIINYSNILRIKIKRVYVKDFLISTKVRLKRVEHLLGEEPISSEPTFSSNFPDIGISAVSMVPTASTASEASIIFTASFHQNKYCSWWFNTPWQPNDQYWLFFVEWIVKNPDFHWYISVLFLSEAVEVSRYYFYENEWN